jgi:hypothetical protein
MVEGAMMGPFIKSSGFALVPLLLLATTARAQSPLDALSLSPDLPPYQWFASTDPKNENNDYFVLQPGQTRTIPLAAGALERLWSTSLFPDKIDLTLVAGPHRKQLLLSGGKVMRGALENKAYTFFPGPVGDSLYRLNKGAALIATNKAKEPTKWFFQAAVRPVAPPLKKEKAREVSRRLFKLSIGPREEKAVENWDSPGEIYEFSVASDGDTIDFGKLRLKASFDGQEAVDVPLLSLAGQIVGTEQVQNAAAEFDGSRLVLRWPMPFNQAKVSLVNEGDKAVSLDVGARVSQFDSVPSSYRFRAFQQSAKSEKGKPISILNVKGAGSLVGLALSITPNSQSTRRTFAYLEGNELIEADGKLFEGTGNEDFFSSAWYFPDKPFFHPYEGMSSKTASPPSVSAYRLMIPDALPFKKSLKFDFEQGNGNSTDDLDWTWTAFWYEKPPLSANPGQSDSASSSSTSSTPESETAPVAPEDRWKLGVAVALGVGLGITSALLRRRRKR